MLNPKISFSNTIVIFGGSGFLGRYVVSLLVKNNFMIKVGVRNPDKAKHISIMGYLGQVSIMKCDITDLESVNKMVQGSHNVINLIGILNENKKQSFNNIHVNGVINIAKACDKYKVRSLIHISALAIDKNESSIYAKSKIEAERVIKNFFKKTIILRPSVIYGAEDDFINKFAKISVVSPFLPLINRGKTKFQPVSVLDVAKAIEVVLLNEKFIGKTFHLGGPEIFSFKEILDLILDITGRKKIYINLNFFIAEIIARIFSIFPNNPMYLDHIKLLKTDNIVPKNTLGFKDLGINPYSMETIVYKYLYRYKVSS